MQSIKKILVPIDFSAYSEAAMRFAVDLSRKYEASIDLLHVYEILTYALPEAYVVPSAEVLERITQHCNVQLAAARQTALQAGASAVATTLVQGGTAEAILHFAKDHASDLIVMGTHGRAGIKHFLIGSVAERVVRAAPCPVLTVRERE